MTYSQPGTNETVLNGDNAFILWGGRGRKRWMGRSAEGEGYEGASSPVWAPGLCEGR